MSKILKAMGVAGWLVLVLMLWSEARSATYYVQTTGSASNSGSTDQDAANLSGSAATHVTTLVTLDGSPDLSGLITAAGATQSTIFLNGSTVTNKKIFKITAFDNSAKTVTVDADPTCAAGACGAWAIGGRVVWTPANIEAALTAGDVVQFNDTPASRTAAFYTARNSGSETAGYIKLMGKSGVRPVLTITNTASVLDGASQSFQWFENFEIDQQGASGNVITSLQNNSVVYNVKITNGGGHGVQGGIFHVFNSEITGVGGDGINSNSGSITVFGNYIHDLTGDGVQTSVADTSSKIMFNIIDTVGAKGIYLSGASTLGTGTPMIVGNVVYNTGESGLQIDDANTGINTIANNIFLSNGNAAGEYNVNWAAGAALSGFHGYNIFFHSNCQGSGTGGPACVNGYTLNALELSSDPQLVDPANGNFALGAASPARAAGYPGVFLGGNTGYMSIGALQLQAGGGGSHIIGGGL